MHLASFYKLFPVPSYLKLSTVGVDISDESIKFVELSSSSKGYCLGSFGEVSLPVGTVVSGKVVNKEALIKSLQQMNQEHNFDYVYASLPEEESFVVQMKVPYVKKSELRGSIELLLEEYIPRSVDQVIFDYETYSESKNANEDYILGVYSSPKDLVSDYTASFQGAGFNLVGLEIEVQSLARALVPVNNPKTYMIVDIGRTRTGFSIISQGIVLFSSTIKSIGGENLTKAVQKATGLEYKEAENLKIKKGLLNSPANKKVFEALIPTISILKDEIVRHSIYWQTDREDYEATEKISKILLCGGQATLPGLVDYLSVDLDIPVEVCEPWTAFANINKKVPMIDFNNSLRYVTAIGLALRGVNLN